MNQTMRKQRWDKQTIQQAFDRLVDKENGPVKSFELGRCWMWRTRPGKAKIRPVMWVGDAPKVAVRVSYELANDVELKPSQHIIMACDNTQCVNPNHARIDRTFDRADTRCPRGHAMTPLNTGIHRHQPYCRVCREMKREGLI